MNNTFVGNFSFGATEETVRFVSLRSIGTVERVSIVTGCVNDKPGVGLVENAERRRGRGASETGW